MTWDRVCRIVLVLIAVFFLHYSCVPTKHFLDPTTMHSRTDLEDQLYAHMKEMLTAWNTPGAAVALIEGGQVVWSAGFGHTTTDETVDVSPSETYFQAASISKTVFTWGLIMLTDLGGGDGTVNLDDPVNEYLDPAEWDLESYGGLNPAWESGATFRRLLGHRGGVNVDGYLGWPPGECCPTLVESLDGDDNNALYGPVRIAWAPDSKFSYSGGGFTVMQLVAERLTGQPIADYLQTAVLGPLGMDHSSYAWTPKIEASRATPYGYFLDKHTNFLFAEKAAAGLYTTAEDLARFAAALLDGGAGNPPGRGILPAETVALLTTCNPPPGMTECDADNGWGLGFEVKKEGGRFLVGHTGGNRGWKALYRTIPDLGVGLVVLTNADAGVYVYREIEWAWKALYLD